MEGQAATANISRTDGMCIIRVRRFLESWSRDDKLIRFRVLSVKGKKVLHIDRNDHYGGEAASVNIETVSRLLRICERSLTPTSSSRSTGTTPKGRSRGRSTDGLMTGTSISYLSSSCPVES